MASGEAPGYPDILGYITGGVQASFGVVQAAVALRPAVVRAGRPLEMMILVQNASDNEVEVTATLRLPERDVRKQKDRFVSKADRLVIRLNTAAVGLVTLPLSTLPDTAPGAEYRIGVEIKVVPIKRGKTGRLRSLSDPATSAEQIPLEHLRLVEELRGLRWRADSAGRFAASTLEIALTVMGGTVGSFADLSPSWTLIWSMANLSEDRELLVNFASQLEALLPQLKRKRTLPVLREYTQQRFANAGMEVLPMELELIARSMAFILELAGDLPAARARDGEAYCVMRYLGGGYLKDPAARVTLPRWCRALLLTFQRDERTIPHALRVIAHFCYDDLLRDVIQESFRRVQDITREDMGEEADREHHTSGFFDALRDKKLTVSWLYTPLLMGTLTMAEYALMGEEKPAEIVESMRDLLSERFDAAVQFNNPLYKLSSTLVEFLSNKYNMSQW